MNKRIIFGIIILLIISGLVLIGYFKTKDKKVKSNFIGVSEVTPGKTVPVPVKYPSQGSQALTTTISEDDFIVSTGTVLSLEKPTTSADLGPYKLLFDQIFFYIDLDYPLLYVYDPLEGLIKYFNLEEKTYREIYKNLGIESVVVSPDKYNFILKDSEKFSLLNLKTDSLISLPREVKNFLFTLDNNLIIYLNNYYDTSRLAYFQDGKVNRIIDIGLLNPEIVYFKDNLLLYEKDSPVFILNLKDPKNLKVFLEKMNNYSLLVNKKQSLIFVSYQERNNWQSKVIDFNKKEKISFSWGTLKDKCSFDDLLVCGVPAKLQSFDKDDWQLFGQNYDEKLVIYDPQKDEIKEINLEKHFDIVRPKITPSGIVFWNRIDGKFYLVELK